MTYYPIVIPTLNRWEHLQRCVESLLKNKEASMTELVIGLDYPPSEKYVDGWQKMKEYVPTIQGFSKITVFERDRNYGPTANTFSLREYVRSHYDGYIFTEDDNTFAPNFLYFMNLMMNKYRDNPLIMSVSGYNHVEFSQQEGGYTHYISPDNCGWGMGIWFHKEDKISAYMNSKAYFRQAKRNRKVAKLIVDTYPDLYRMLCIMLKKKTRWGDVMRTIINLREGYYQIRATHSLVRNEGYDGTGVNCGDESPFEQMKLGMETSFDEGIGLGPWDTASNRSALLNQGFEGGFSEEERVAMNHGLRRNTHLLYRCRLAIAIIVFVIALCLLLVYLC